MQIIAIVSKHGLHRTTSKAAARGKKHDRLNNKQLPKARKLEKADINNLVLSASSAIASLPKDEKYKPIIITLKILNDTWLQIRNEDDEIILSRLMNKNDEYSYNLKSNYSITSGNAGHILVVIDQKVRGKIGKKGQVVDSLVLNKDFSN